jgi:hypothetical protein
MAPLLRHLEALFGDVERKGTDAIRGFASTA